MKQREKSAVSVYEYRCRRCQEIFTGTIEDQFSFLVSEMENLNYLTDPEGERTTCEDARKELKDDEELLTEKASLFRIHICDDDGRGLSDLIGCEPGRAVTINRGSWRGKSRDFAKANFAGRVRNGQPIGSFKKL
jgi:hypothetical protein